MGKLFIVKSNLINCIFTLSIIGLLSIHNCVQQAQESTPRFREKQFAYAAAAGGLKTLAEQHGILFGALYQYDIHNETYDQIFQTEMNAMAVGTFWTDGSRPNRTGFNFSQMDTTVNWGRARGITLYGQTLVWFDDIPDWLKAAPTADVEQIMNQHIDTTVGRYAGQIKFWNVVNEAVSDDGTLRQNNTWTNAMGTDYIRKAFIRAHAADPTAVLYYNDYAIESSQTKFEGVKALLISLKNQGVPVRALGWQLHVTPSSFDAATLLGRMNEIANLGFDNYITELDVELPVNATVTGYQQQKQTYKTVVETYLAATNHKSIVVWGLRDGDPYWLTNNHPLLFDENFHRKPAYFGVQEALNSTITTTSTSTTSATTPIPEFPSQALVPTLLAAVIVAASLVALRRTSREEH